MTLLVTIEIAPGTGKVKVNAPYIAWRDPLDLHKFIKVSLEQYFTEYLKSKEKEAIYG